MNRYITEKKNYVQILNSALEPMIDFGSVQYLNVHSTGAEYLKLNDSMGGAKFLNVTSLDCESILLETIAVLVSGNSERIVKTKEDRRAVAALFERAS